MMRSIALLSVLVTMMIAGMSSLAPVTPGVLPENAPAMSEVLQEATATPVKYHLLTSDPGTSCNLYRDDPAGPCLIGDSGDGGGAMISTDLWICVHRDVDIYTFATWAADGLSPDTSLYLRRPADYIWQERDDAGTCAAVGFDVLHVDSLSPIDADNSRSYYWHGYAVGGNGVLCNPDQPNVSQFTVVISSTECFLTPTPTSTPTPTGSPTPTPTPGGTPVPTMEYQVSECADVSYIHPWATRLHAIDDGIDSINATIATSSTVFSDVVISSNPVSLARGFIILMNDIVWLRAIFIFFTLAFAVIIIMFAIRLLASMWGVVEKIKDIKELIPFIG